MRVPVLNPDGTPAMPTKPSRARRWLHEGKAKVVHNDLNIFCIQLVAEPTGSRDTQPIAVGIDPGKAYSGFGVQSARATLFMAHSKMLPFQTVKDRMEQRRMMRRNRRHRKCRRRPTRFNNRRFKKVPSGCAVAYGGASPEGGSPSAGKWRWKPSCSAVLPPSIKANRQLELRVVKELLTIYPVTSIVYEVVKASGDKSFSPVMVGQYWMLLQLEALRPTFQLYGWETAQIRTQLGLEKQKSHRQFAFRRRATGTQLAHKGDAVPQTHAVDGTALAASQFVEYQSFHTANTHGHHWVGECNITPAPFAVIRRPPISRRQLHLMVPAKGGGGIRRKYGGTVTRHGVRFLKSFAGSRAATGNRSPLRRETLLQGCLTTPQTFRKGDFVKAEQAGRISTGWVSGDTERQVSVSDINWKRLAQFTAKKVQLIRRSTGLLVAKRSKLSKLGASNP